MIKFDKIDMGCFASLGDSLIFSEVVVFIFSIILIYINITLQVWRGLQKALDFNFLHREKKLQYY